MSHKQDTDTQAGITSTRDLNVIIKSDLGANQWKPYISEAGP